MLLLKRARQQVGWSQSELARRAHMDPSKICKLESGFQHPSLNDVVRLARALGCPPSILIGESSEETAGTPPERL